MKQQLLALTLLLFAFIGHSQITITQSDFGQAGDSMIIATESPSTVLSVGGTGQQTWNYTLSVDNINTLKFEYVSNTNSGSYYPSANLAIERQTDTLFFKSTSSAFMLQGVAGDAIGIGASIRVKFNPEAKMVTFPSTLGTSFTDTAVFDTIVSCAEFGFGSTCDSARLRRELISISVFNAYGMLNTTGGSYNTVRQYITENNIDNVWLKFPFIGWSSTPAFTADSIAYNYRWYANGEQWPVLAAVASGPGGNIISAEFQVDSLLAYTSAQSNPLCHNDCNGSATVQGLGAVPPYTYAWPASAGGGSSATATGLCAGTYVVTITDNASHVHELEVVITNPSLIQITGSVQGVSVGGDGAIDITASGGAGSYTYSWSGPDGFVSTSADLNGIDEGAYTVTVTDTNGCDTTRLFMVGLTAVPDAETDHFRLYPNPANNLLQVASKAPITRIKIMDLLGNVVQDETYSANSVNIVTTDLRSGIYMVEVQTPSGNYLRKLTVKH